jgi:ribonuclease D
LRGWRRRLFGEKALALKAGELGLSVVRGSVVVSPMAQPSEV